VGEDGPSTSPVHLGLPCWQISSAQPCPSQTSIPTFTASALRDITSGAVRPQEARCGTHPIGVSSLPRRPLVASLAASRREASALREGQSPPLSGRPRQRPLGPT